MHIDATPAQPVLAGIGTEATPTLKSIDFWFDPISPYASLAFERLPVALAGLSYCVNYRPVLLAGLLREWGQKGPAETPPKRAWIYRQVAWAAHRDGVELQLPALHPFNPLALLRLMLACGPADSLPNRRVCEAVLRHVWRGGADPADAQRLQALTAALMPKRDPSGDEVKAELRAATQQALEIGVFGVPTLVVDGRLFWGLDSLEMVAACLRGDAWFDGPGWLAAAAARPGPMR